MADSGMSIYELRDSMNGKVIPLLTWDIYGPYILSMDSVRIDSIVHGDLALSNIETADSLNRFKRAGIYHPICSQLDFKEVYGISPSDTLNPIDSLQTFLTCMLNSPSTQRRYLEIKHSMPLDLWLNGDSVTRKDIQGLNVYALDLQAGSNILMARAVTSGQDLSCEMILYDSLSIISKYLEEQCNNIEYALIWSDVNDIMLTNAHQNLLDVPVTLSHYDVEGTLLDEQILQKDTMVYHVNGLKKGASYLCTLRIGNKEIQQTVLCGTADESFARYSLMRDSLPSDHPRLQEINNLLYRFRFLLNHPSRTDGDWWWQFKIPTLTYQLEYIFAHLSGSYDETNCGSCIQFVTYKSPLDGGTQRYLIALPSRNNRKKKMPLVVVVRPNIENHYHFFTGPQMARQWALNQMQALADRYGYAVMMPEMRTYHCEDITPMVDAEFLSVLKDVQKRYHIDQDRIYLHANCSGGYRALRLATKHPQLFAAIALYAPVYHCVKNNTWSMQNAPEHSLNRIKDIPVMIHYDPIDGHSPYSLYSDLIQDLKAQHQSLTLSVKRNSGILYNVLLVGEEAFNFFKGKKRGTIPMHRSENNQTMQIADFYSEPYVYVYNSNDSTKEYGIWVDSVRNEYESYFHSALPLIADTLVSKQMMCERNIFILGNGFAESFCLSLPQGFLTSVLLNNQRSMEIMMLLKNPINPDRKIILDIPSRIDSPYPRMEMPWENGMRPIWVE